jgi:hypothetical protein
VLVIFRSFIVFLFMGALSIVKPVVFLLWLVILQIGALFALIGLVVVISFSMLLWVKFVIYSVVVSLFVLVLDIVLDLVLLLIEINGLREGI